MDLMVGKYKEDCIFRLWEILSKFLELRAG